MNRVVQHPLHGFLGALAAVAVLSVMDAVMKALVIALGIYSLSIWRSLFNLALMTARLTGRGTGLGEAAVVRMRNDLVFDPAPAQRDFGYAPRGFMPTARMFESRGDEDGDGEA